MEKKEFPVLLKIVIIILSFVAGLFNFFGGFQGSMFFSSSVDWTSGLAMAIIVLSPFWIAGIITGVFFIFSYLFKKKINVNKTFFYSALIYAGIISFNTATEITNNSAVSFLIVGFVIAIIWILQGMTKNRQKLV